ncbi:MAG: hypothetical protein MRY32_00295 [Rickettsiales bacterium]|nr:hypothetical protein [Rickettsiales bacterium]
MRKYLIAIVVLVVVGVLVSFFLIPDEGQIALMQRRDATSRTAGYVDYQAEFDRGNRTEEVVVGLANLYIGEGRGLEALPILEAHVQENPGHVEARKKLAELYQAAGRDEDYLREIETVASQQPTEENLKLLADMYNYVGMYDKQIETLKRLIDVSQGNVPEYYVDLATIQTLQEQKQEASLTLVELRQRHPNHISFKLVRLMVTSLVDTGEVERAHQEASGWIARPRLDEEGNNLGPDTRELADLANIIHYGGRPDLALELMNGYRELITKDVELFVAYINASIVAGKREQAYVVMNRAYDQGKLPPKLYRPFIELAFERGEIDKAQSVVYNLDRQYFNEDEAINLLELARANESNAIVAELIRIFDVPQYTQNKPALVAIIALLRRDTDEDMKIDVAIGSDLTRNSRFRLAQACARHDKEECFNRLVEQFPTFAEMTPREVDEVVELYISVDKQKQIETQVKALSEETDSPIIDFAYIKIAASLNQKDIVRPWLTQHGADTETPKLASLYFIANNRRHGVIASDVAEILYNREPSQVHREYLVSAYMNSGQYAKALPYLRELRDTTRANEDMYLTSLTRLARGGAEYRKELLDYVTPQLDSDEIELERKRQLVFMLINSGNKAKAVPYINKYAKAHGGEWKKLYNQVHARYIPPSKWKGAPAGPAMPALADMPRDYRVEVAMDPSTTDEVRRMLAFSLLEDGYRDDAVYIFQALAEKKGPMSQEVRDLLFLWGPRLNEEQIDWMVVRASQSSGADLVKWGEYIAFYGDDYALMNYVSSNPNALSHSSIRKKYFNALAVNGTADAFDSGMREWMAAESDPMALKDYADVAKAYGYRDAAVRALKKINGLVPQNEIVLKDLGVLTYSQSDYSEAQRYIGQYMYQHTHAPAPQTHPFEAYFFQGELLRREKRTNEANQYYAQVLRDGPSVADTVQRQSMYYSAQMHLGYYNEGKDGFYGLLEQYPEDRSLLADFMSILLEYNFYDEATAVANQYDSNSPYYHNQVSHPASIQSPHIQNIQSYEQGRELRINFNQPLNGEVPPGFDPKQYSWIEESEVGYDSMLIAAKPGYQLRFTPTSEQAVRVVPTRYVLTAEEEMRRQQELRLQLLYARLELETGQEQAALNRLNTLRAHYPKDAQLLGYTANAQNYTGNWSSALNLLEEAQDITPENEDILALKDDIERLHADHVKLDFEAVRIGDSDQYIGTVEGKVRVTNRVEIGGEFKHNKVFASNIRNASNGQRKDQVHERQKGELWAAYHFDNGDTLKGAAYANNDTAGAGLSYAFNNALGRSEVLAEYHRPYWDFTEAVVEEATRDRVGIRHRANITNKTSVSAEASYNRYNIKSEEDVAQTALLRANVVHQLRAEQPYVGVGYGFDGEYVVDKTYRPLGVTGDKYSPFPITSREIHFVSGIVAHDVTDSTRAELVAGYAYDRLGDHGPQVEGRITQDLGENVEAQVRARYGLESNDSEQNASSVGGHLKVKF